MDEIETRFPREEQFTDCRGHVRKFVIHLNSHELGHFLTARERHDGPGRYEFCASSETSPYLALGELRDKIRRGLATRYLSIENDRPGFSHDTIEGRIERGKVVIDATAMPVEQSRCSTSMRDPRSGSRFSTGSPMRDNTPPAETHPR